MLETSQKGSLLNEVQSLLKQIMRSNISFTNQRPNEIQNRNSINTVIKISNVN